MRKYILLLFCLLVLSGAFGQQRDTSVSAPITKEALLRKSRLQKTAGWFLVGTGAPVVIACLYFLTFPDDVLSEKGKVALALAGGAGFVWGGVSLINSGKQNKEKALLLSLQRQKVVTPFASRAGYLQPAVSLRFQF